MAGDQQYDVRKAYWPYWPPATKGELEQCKRDWAKVFGLDPARPGSERTAMTVDMRHLGPLPAGTEIIGCPSGFIVVCPGDPPKLVSHDGTVTEIAPPADVQIVENPSAQVLLYERAADAIVALINSKPASPTRDEIIAALKGLK